MVGTIAAALFGVYAAVCVAARLLYPRVLFPARRIDAVPAEIAADEGRPVLLALSHASGGDTRALYYAPPAPEGRVVVVFHGNGETMFDETSTAAWLRGLGLGAMLVEYRGYGLSYGPPPSEDALYEDGEAALAWLRGAAVPNERVVLWGASLGTGVAAEMAKRGHGGSLVLVSPFTSIVDIGRRLAWFLPVRLLLAHRLDTLSKAGRIRIPTLVVHGDADEVVPFDMGVRVARAIAGAELVRVEGGHHDDLFAVGEGHRPSGDALLARIARHLAAPVR